MTSDAPTAKPFLMTRERWAGVIFLIAAVGIVAFIAIFLGSAASRDLRYTVVFDAGKDARIGDRVQLNGVDVGQVQDVKLINGGRAVEVRLKIMAEHKAKISSQSTAYIASSTALNVSGQKVVEIYNSSQTAPPMRPNAVVEGKDTLLELNAWRLKDKASEWGDSLAKAGRDLRDSARELEAGARKSLNELTREATPNPAAPAPPPKTPGSDSKLEPAEPRRSGGLPGSARSTDAAEAAEPDPAVRPPARPAGKAGDEAAQARELIHQLTQFLADLGARGKKDLQALVARWNQLQHEAGTLTEKLTKMGREILGEQLKALIEQVRRQIESLRDRGEEGDPPLERPMEPMKDARSGEPVPI